MSQSAGPSTAAPGFGTDLARTRTESCPRTVPPPSRRVVLPGRPPQLLRLIDMSLVSVFAILLVIGVVALGIAALVVLIVLLARGRGTAGKGVES